MALKRKRAPKAVKKTVSDPTSAEAPGGQERPGSSGAAPEELCTEELHPKKLYGPGEVVRASGISRQVLHNYTVLGLLQPAEVTRTSRRYYDERVFGRIKLIRRMLESGYRLHDLREAFKWED